MFKPDKIKPVLHVLLTSLIFFLLVPLMAQEVMTLRQGKNTLGTQDIKYKKLVISITPELTYRVNEKNQEVIGIQFKAEWTEKPKDDWIFIINDPVYFKEFIQKTKNNWNVNKKIKDELKKTLEFKPANIIGFTAVQIPLYFTDSSYKITADVQNYQNETITMNVLFYLGTSNGLKGFDVDQKAEIVKWDFKLPHRASKDCEEKYDVYKSQLNELKPERNRNRFDDFILKEDKTEGELQKFRESNDALKILINNIEEDITNFKCDNLRNILSENKQFLIQDSEFKDIKISLNVKQSAIEQEKADVSDKLGALYDNRSSIKIHYRELKKMHWEAKTTKTFDNVMISNKGRDLDDLYKMESATYVKLLENSKVSPEMRLLKNDFDSYYEASIRIIKDFSTRENENQNVSQSNKQASNIKKLGKRLISLIWYVLPVLAFISGIAVFKYWGKIKKVLSFKRKIK